VLMSKHKTRMLKRGAAILRTGHHLGIEYYFSKHLKLSSQSPACSMGETSMRATCSAQTEYRSDHISLTPIRYLNTVIRLRSNIFIKEIQ